MSFNISHFNTAYMQQLEKLPPEEWQTNAFDLFLYNEWQPWFFPFQAVIEDQLVGFGMFFLFDDFAWLGWILAHKDFRGRGIGTSMTRHLISSAKEKGAKGIILTATEMGRPVYEKLGFRTTSTYRFFNIPEMFSPNYDKNLLRKAIRKDLSEIAKLDQRATGEKRNSLLENGIDECIVYDDGKIEGFYLPDLGTGFIVANNENAGLELVKLRCATNKKVIVVPELNKTAIDFFRQNNFSEGYSIPRMTLGKQPDWKPEMIFNRASGYTG